MSEPKASNNPTGLQEIAEVLRGKAEKSSRRLQLQKTDADRQNNMRQMLVPMGVESRKLYREEGVTVTASCEKGSVTGPCLEVSSIGLTFLQEAGESFSISLGQKIAITVSSPQGKSSVIEAEVKSVAPFKGQTDKAAQVVTADFNYDFPSELHLSNLRGSPMIELPARYQPQATSGDPLFSTGYLLYRIESFTSKGARLHTCGRGVPILPGFQIQLRILLPNVNEVTVSAQILKVKVDHAEAGFILEVLFLDLNPDHEAAIGEHLLFSAPALSIKELKTSGFFLDSARKALRVSFCNSEADWMSVLNLRLQAYQGVGKFLEKKSALELQDRFDSYARQIIVKSGAKIVGAARIVFVEKNRDRSEHVALGIKVPDELFNQSIVEASRGCTDPNYRGDDVFLMISQKVFETCLQTSHDVILTNCNPEMWPMYKKLGYQKLGVRFAGFGRDDCELIAVYPKKILYGQASNLLYWGYLWGDSVKHVLRNPSSDLTWKDKLQALLPMTVQRLISKPLAKNRRLKKYKQLRTRKSFGLHSQK